MGKRRKKKTVYRRMNNKADNKVFKLEEILQQKIVRQYLVAYVGGYIFNIIFFMRGERLTSLIHLGIIIGMTPFTLWIDIHNHPKWSRIDAMGHTWKTMAVIVLIWIFYIAVAFLFNLFGLDIRPFLGLRN